MARRGQVLCDLRSECDYHVRPCRSLWQVVRHEALRRRTIVPRMVLQELLSVLDRRPLSRLLRPFHCVYALLVRHCVGDVQEELDREGVKNEGWSKLRE